MLIQLDKIVREYMYRCEKTDDIDAIQTWFVGDKYGIGEYYDQQGILLGRWTFDIKGQFSIGWSKDFYVSGLVKFTKFGQMIESKKYYETGELYNEEFYDDSSTYECSYYKNGIRGYECLYKGNQVISTRSWDEAGVLRQPTVKTYWCCWSCWSCWSC
jgi:hypothetical protein